MRKFTLILSLLIAMTTFAQTTGYEVNYTGTKSGDRPLNFVKLQSASYGTSNYSLSAAETLQLYVDATATVTMKVGAGDIVTPAVGYGGSWMHAYVYIDADGDGTFTAGVADDGYTPTGDLVSYSAYNADPDGYGQWRNSAGDVNGNNTVALPEFKAPEQEGTYRMRFKIDWNSIDPAGCNDPDNQLNNNRGSIIDVTLEVAEPQEGYVEQFFTPTTITDGKFAKGTSWYTLQIAANGFVIGNNGSADHIALEEVVSDATSDTQLWAFTGDNTNGYKLYNKEAGTAKVLAAPTAMGSNTGANAYPILADAADIPAGYTDTWLFTASTDLGEGDTYFYMYEKGYPSNKVNNRDNKLAFWNGGADAGSTLNIRFAQAEYKVSTGTGEWTASNTAGTWASGWKSAKAPHVIFSETQARNNIAGYDNDGNLQLFTCLDNAAINGQHIATYSIAAEDEDYMIAGYSFNFVSSGTSDVAITPAGRDAVTAGSSEPMNVTVENNDEAATLTFDVTSSSNMFANTSDFYITIVRKAPYVEPSENIFVTQKGGTPYRIPAIAMAKNGDLIAVADYRHSGADIGVVNNGRIDLLARISKDNGTTWDSQFAIVEGQGANSPDFMHVGFGDPAIVADRESDRVLVLSCAGNVSFQQGTRNHHQNIARFYSEDNGKTWSEPVDIAESIYSMWDNSTHGPVMAMFVGSGKIHQSRYVKVNGYYRLYCAVLLKNKNATYTNFVLYSDDFGGSWSVLGGVDTAPIPSGGDEPKVEELPNGNVVISSRINGGRDFNIFSFTDAANAEGSWGVRATSNASVNGVVAQGNSTNGEILIVPAVRNEDGKNIWIALQSLPFGSGRNNVGIYYKELASETDYNTPANFAKDWDGRHQASNLPSAYSTMCLQKDSTIAFLYEESTFGADYTIVYKNYSLDYITDGAYTITGDTNMPEPDNTPSEETIALIEEAKALLVYTGLGYPSGNARETFETAIATAEGNPTEAAGTALSAAIEAYLTTNDINRPENGKTYTFTAVWGTNEYYMYNNNGTLAVAARTGEVLPEAAQFVCEYDAEAEYKFQFKTADGAYYLAYPTLGGKSWLDNESLTGLEASSGKVTMFNVNKILAGGEVAAGNEALFGLVQMDGYRGYDNGKYVDTYGPIVVKHSAATFDGANAPYYNANFTSAFRIEEVEETPETVEPLEVVGITPDNNEALGSLEQIVVTFNTPVTLDETKEIKLVSITEEEKPSNITPIEAYTGSWNVVSAFGNEGYVATGTIEVTDYNGNPALICKGFAGLDPEIGYDDSFLMLYNTKDGSVVLPAQNLAPLNYEGATYETVLYLSDSNATQVFGGTLIGNIKNGDIVFSNSPENKYIANSFMFYAPGMGTISYFNELLLTSATSASAPAKTKAPSRMKVNTVAQENRPIAAIAKSGMNKATEVKHAITAEVNPDDATQLVITVNEPLANGTYDLVIEAGAVVTAEGAANEQIVYTYIIEAETGIEGIGYESKSDNVYDLTGRKVETPAKGIYIINGKKVLIK